MLAEEDTLTETKSARKLPDPAICSATQLGGVDLFECLLVKKSFECKFACEFGDRFFCVHPERVQIAAGTELI